MRKTVAVAVGIASALTGLAVGYPVLARTACRTWGATAAEVERTMPGDDLLTDPTTVTTRAITIAAAPEQIWPWLVQMGPGRGGAYTYDWIENLMGLDMHSADSILPRFQQLAVGDVLPMGDSGPRMRVAVLEPARAMVLASDDGNWVWAFGLYPVAGGTRLVSRNRIVLPDSPLPARMLYLLFMEPGSLIMERKMLSGIAERAGHTEPASPEVTKDPGARSESQYSAAPAARTLDV
ncbi:SRPBCC family protein [Nocardia sp. NBC_01503]|uniref:SRPBCC family protein n=1 Tax=Nocardia sp. NBC_01503 TaxID=2975997 RepID=UPI002E7BCC68|nr:SRPBCC family protein [Nocardia sp. NBC_01503]WTL30657.1 SRPBCC family protein [Nocardia sp. NBC_01503]